MKEFNLVEEYLAENGYTRMHSNPEKTWANFVSMDGASSIEVVFKNNEYRAYGCGFLPESMIQLKTGDFSLPNKNLFFNLRKIEIAIKAYEHEINY